MSENVTAAAEAEPLVALQIGGSGMPIICVHAQAGHVQLYQHLARHLAPEHPVYGLQAAPTPTEGVTFERMAGRYADEVLVAQPGGRLVIIGECTGGALAYELAQQLSARGHDVALLALIDAFPPRAVERYRRVPALAYRTMHRTQILRFHFSNLARLDARDKLAYVKERAERHIRRAHANVADRGADLNHPAGSELAFKHAFSVYEPKSYPGRVVLFRAARLPWGIQTTGDLGWAEFVRDIVVEEVPGYFSTPILEPTALADRLRKRIDNVSRSLDDPLSASAHMEA
jgi:thioesterase domain-containing protein